MNQTTTINEAELKKARKLANKLGFVIRKRMESGIWTGTFNIYGGKNDILASSLSVEQLIVYLNSLHASIIDCIGKDALDDGRLDVAYKGDGSGLQVVFYPSKGERIFVCPA